MSAQVNPAVIAGCSCGAEFYDTADLYDHVCIGHPYADDPWYHGDPPPGAIDRGSPSNLRQRISEYIWRNSGHIKTDFDWSGWNNGLEILRRVA